LIILLDARVVLVDAKNAGSIFLNKSILASIGLFIDGLYFVMGEEIGKTGRPWGDINRI
jgi:hypothetical protein